MFKIFVQKKINGKVINQHQTAVMFTIGITRKKARRNLKKQTYLYNL